MVRICFYSSSQSQPAVDFPSQWDDLTREETQTVCSALASNAGRAALVIALLAGRAKAAGTTLPANWQHRVGAEDLTIQVLPLLDALLEKPELTRQHYPRLCRALGPAGNFDDITVAEYEACEYYASQYAQTQSKAHLLEIVRTLWRPVAHPGSKKRPAYDPQNSRLRPASFFAKLPDPILHTIFLWYTSCRASLPLLFPDAFAPGGPSAGGEHDPMAIAKLIHAAAGPKNGTRPQLRQTLLKEFLFECQQCALEQQRLEELYSNQSV